MVPILTLGQFQVTYSLAIIEHNSESDQFLELCVFYCCLDAVYYCGECSGFDYEVADLDQEDYLDGISLLLEIEFILNHKVYHALSGNLCTVEIVRIHTRSVNPEINGANVASHRCLTAVHPEIPVVIGLAPRTSEWGIDSNLVHPV